MSCPVLELRDRLSALQAEEDAQGGSAALTAEQHAIYWALPTVEPASWEGAAIALAVLAEEVLEGVLKGWVSDEAGPALIRCASAFRQHESGAPFWGLHALEECLLAGYPAAKLRMYVRLSAIVQNPAFADRGRLEAESDQSLGCSA